MALRALSVELKANLSAECAIVLPGDATYEQSIKRWSEAAIKPAGMIIYPTTASDVSHSLLFAQKHALDLAVVCGGHSSGACSSTAGGLCIDLSQMREVGIDEARKLIHAGGGCLWEDVDREAEKFGLATVGGTVNHTGVGGLTLGGGYGYLNGVHGLVVDNLVEVEMVLADGRVVVASERENEDLFWAVRGAGTNFGIVTKFVYQGHDQGPVWAAILVFPITHLPQVIEAANRNFGLKNGSSTVLVAIADLPPERKPVIMIILFYNGPESVAQAHYVEFLGLEGTIVKTASVICYSKLNSLLNDSLGFGFRRSLKGSAFIPPLDIGFAQELAQELKSFVERFPDAQSSIILFEFIPFDKIISVPLTATAFGNRGAYGGILFSMGWTSEEIDGECRLWTREMSKKSREVFEKRRAELVVEGVAEDGVGEYFNYDGIATTGKEAFGVNYPRLVELKKQYDPDNVFNKGPKLMENAVVV